MTDMRDLVDALADAAPAPPVRLRQGVITAKDTTTVSVAIGGSSTAVTGIKYLNSYSPTVADAVWLATDGRDWMVLGKLGTGSDGVVAALSRIGTLETTRPISPNYIINGGFDIWQRGTSFSSAGYTADRWALVYDGTGATRTVSQQAFTPGSAPVAGYESSYFLRWQQSVAGTGGTYNDIVNRIEDVRTLAGQVVTISFWAKADAARVVTIYLNQNFGSGGSGQVGTGGTVTVGTSWARYSLTITLPSISGKTIGAGSYLGADFFVANNSTFTLDIWGVQVEQGTTATPFRRNANSLQAELAACQRYYWRLTNSSSSDSYVSMGWSFTSTDSMIPLRLPVTMRRIPDGTLERGGSVKIQYFSNSVLTLNSASINTSQSTNDSVAIQASQTGGTANAGCMFLVGVNSYIGINAEL